MGTCGEFVMSMDEALAHCSLGRAQNEVGFAGGPEDEHALPTGEAIAYDGRGRPTIVRAVDPETGLARTHVKHEDGSHHIFDQNTMSTLTEFSDAS